MTRPSALAAGFLILSATFMAGILIGFAIALALT